MLYALLGPVLLAPQGGSAMGTLVPGLMVLLVAAPSHAGRLFVPKGGGVAAAPGIARVR
jgi:hypothetical protein